MCRGESSCILPISPAAVHTNPTGSRLAIEHFTSTSNAFPDDLEVRWLLNLAHMTLGEYPDKVDPGSDSIWIGSSIRSSTSASSATSATWSGSIASTRPAARSWTISTTTACSTSPSRRSTRPSRWPIYRNKGDGTFEDRSRGGRSDRPARRTGLLSDRLQQRRPPGHLHRAGALASPADPAHPAAQRRRRAVHRRHQGGGHARRRSIPTRPPGPITTTTAGSTCSSAASDSPTASITTGATARSRRSPRKAGVQGEQPSSFCKGCTWIDYDNDGYPDLFLNNLAGLGELYHNNRDGTFTDVTSEMGIDGPITASRAGRGTTTTTAGSTSSPPATTARSTTWSRACSGSRTAGIPTGCSATAAGKAFEDVTAEAGLDMVFATMGSNFGDFDNDGFLDMYLGTGEPSLAHAGPQPHVQERRRQAVRRDHRLVAAPATCKRATASPAATGTATATSTSSSRPAAPSTATSITTSCFRTPARETTG